MTLSIKEHTFNTENVPLNYAEVPTATQPLLLIHGGSSQWHNFENLIPDLAANWHLYALDLRGHGQSGRANGRYRLQDFADDVIAFLSKVVAEPAVIFGHSLGGMVALMVAGQRPELVRAVVVGDSPLTAQTWKTHFDTHRDSFLKQQGVAGGQVPLAEIARVVKGIPAIFVYQTDPDVYAAFLGDFEKTAVGYEMDTLLPAVQCPVLLLQADPTSGGVMTDAEAAQAMRLLPNASHVFLPGMSHVLHNEQKEPVLESIVTFLNKL
jgi:pimeloyl-ACP methyl ester carboxylesterase